MNKKGIILVILGAMILIVMLILYQRCSTFNQELLVSSISTFETKVDKVESKRILTDDEIKEIYINTNIEIINYVADIFKIDSEVFIENLKNNSDIDLTDSEGIDYKLIEYLLVLEESNPELFDNSIEPCEDDQEYILALIKYFCGIYSDVDFTIAAAIAEVESGFSAQSMLNKNNVFGGMSRGSLIKYKNIEYGILSYIKLLNDGYFGKGLTTVETIGYVYNPTYNDQGVKVANPNWVSKVNNALSHYTDYNELDITITDLITIQNGEV